MAAKKSGGLSPMMEQYFDVKSRYPGMLLFFRLGDFYEMFFDDAKTAADELDLVLTGKECGMDERAPMCGVPFHSADSYIAKLVNRGYKVAICEQLEDPKLVKGLVKRDVVRIITPGTVIEGNMLDDSTNNYLCCICRDEKETGLCFADVSTAEFHLTAIKGADSENKIIDQLAAYMPKEVLVNSAALDYARAADFLKARNGTQAQLLEDEKFDYNAATELILETLKKDEISSLSLGSSKPVVRALAPADIDYFESDRYLKLDMNARRNLELTKSMMTGDKRHSLLWVLDKTKTPMGRRMIRNWLERPLMSAAQIIKRQNAVGELADNPELRDKLRTSFSGISDMERLMTRIAYSTANAKELKSLQQTVQRLPQIKSLLAGCQSALLKDISGSIDPLEDVEELIGRAISEEPPLTVREGGMIKSGYNEQVDELRSVMEDGAGVVAAIEARQREETGIPKLKVGYNRVFGYYIEVTNSYKDMVPETYIRKQTLTNCERYITQELKELEGKIVGAKDRSVVLEYQVFCSVRETISRETQRIQKTAKALAVLDTLASLAEAAATNNYCCPQISTNGVIDIKDGRHPVVEAIMNGAPFVPNDTVLDTSDNRCMIITGPNMAGKSTYMRQIALIVIMAQIGSFVPARSADIGIVDAVFTRVGAADDLATGRSTFMVEMSEVSDILKNATQNSLIILDEIGRGTSTFDGMSIARAVLEFVCKKKTLGAKTLFATHYHELTAMEGLLDGVKNYSIAVKKRGDDITFLRRIVRGGADESFGIEVAKLAGVPDSVVRRAKVILKELEQNKIDIEFKAEDAVLEEEEDIQYNFAANGKNEILEILKATDVNTLTPIEAMQTLYDLKKKAEEL